MIGGAEIFEEAIPLAQQIYLSVVQAEIEGDTYMPHFAGAEWKEVIREVHPADARNPYAFEFTVLDRV